MEVPTRIEQGKPWDLSLLADLFQFIEEVRVPLRADFLVWDPSFEPLRLDIFLPFSVGVPEHAGPLLKTESVVTSLRSSKLLLVPLRRSYLGFKVMFNLLAEVERRGAGRFEQILSIVFYFFVGGRPSSLVISVSGRTKFETGTWTNV